MICFKPLIKSNEFVRDWPYPYRAGISISSDVEFTSLAYYDELMKWVNSKNNTKFGIGLGIEVTGSIFFYSSTSQHMSIFKGDNSNAPLSDDVNRLTEYIETNWIDTNHCFGDFDSPSKFSRYHAIRAYEFLNKKNLKLPIFTNHGGENNIQGIGRYAYRTGDVPGSKSFHSDLLKPNHVKYFWSEKTSYEPIYWDNLSILQSAKILANLLKKKITSDSSEEKFLSPVILNDGTSLLQFWRYRGTGIIAPNASSFAYQLATFNWDLLLNRRGVVMFYQHLGVKDRISGKCSPMTIEDAISRPELFLAPFRLIQKKSEDNLLWVAGQHRLLRYLDMLERTCVKKIVNQSNQVFELSVSESCNCDDQAYFEGLTLYVDARKEVDIFHKGERVRFVFNGPDESGQYSVTVPITKLSSVW